ncbi:MAG: hypothetical protein U5K38_14810 [Woeseiaceae bacterium]|nr:hypothetical protein [Woeseiaceae bacterium]
MSTLAIRLQLGTAVRMMDHAAAHRHQQFLDRFEDVRVPQRPDSARRKGKVDRAAPRNPLMARIRLPFMNADSVAAPRQQHR